MRTIANFEQLANNNNNVISAKTNRLIERMAHSASSSKHSSCTVTQQVIQYYTGASSQC